LQRLAIVILYDHDPQTVRSDALVRRLFSKGVAQK